MRILLSSSFEPLLYNQSRYLVLCGGRGSGKSEFCARKILFRCWTEGGHRYLVLRKIRRTLSESVIALILSILKENDISYEYNKSDRQIIFNSPTGRNEILFEGLDDPEKLKSIKGITSLWIEETTELTREDFLRVDLVLREPFHSYHQIMMSFNPEEAQAPWLKEMFFGATPHPNSTVHISTIEDNPIRAVRETYLPVLEELKYLDDALYRIARLGQWAERSGRIFSWDVEPLPKMKFDEIFYGLDFGYSVDPTAVVRVYRRADEFWLEELLYQKGLTNQDIAENLKALGVSGAIYCDSAEPKSIAELRRLGISARESLKGQDSVRASIDYLLSKKIHIIEGSINLFKEAQGYCWRKERSTGRLIPEPIEFDNHLIDATRYAIYTHCARARPRVWRVSTLAPSAEAQEKSVIHFQR